MRDSDGLAILRLVPVEPSQRRIGPFEVLGPLGRGAMGTVVHARDAAGRDLALKLLVGDCAPGQLERFWREGQITASLRHPGIVEVHGAGTHEGRPYLVYELVEGTDLGQQLDRLGRDALLDIVLQAAQAVGHAHTQGVVHRDLKPDNILVAREGRCRVADFGLAQVGGMERLTRTGAIVGTPAYMAPEQAGAAREAYGPPTDVWALGVLLYRVLTKREPFQSDSLMDLLAQIAKADPTPPRRMDPSISPGLEAVCLKALEKDPGRRYPNGAALAEDLALALSGAAPRASQDARGPGKAALLALGALLLVLLPLTVWQAWPQAPTPSDAPARPRPRRDVGPSARLAQRLSQALQSLREGQRPAGITALRSLAPRLRDSAGCHTAVREARDERLTRALGAVSTGDAMAILPHLEEIALLHQALPEGEPTPEALRELSTSLMLLARERLGDLSDQAGLEILTALARHPVFRAVEPDAALDLVDIILTAANSLPASDYKALIKASIQLDLPVGEHTLEQVSAEELRLDGDAWCRYMSLRQRASREELNPRARSQLLLLLERPRDLALGPIQWAEAACWTRSAQSPRRYLELLRKAEARDPTSPRVQRYLGLTLVNLGEKEEACAAALRSVELFEGQRQHERLSTLWEHKYFLKVAIEVLAKGGDRAAARRTFVKLQATESSGAVAQVLELWPWLEETP